MHDKVLKVLVTSSYVISNGYYVAYKPITFLSFVYIHWNKLLFIFIRDGQRLTEGRSTGLDQGRWSLKMGLWQSRSRFSPVSGINSVRTILRSKRPPVSRSSPRAESLVPTNFLRCNLVRLPSSHLMLVTSCNEVSGLVGPVVGISTDSPSQSLDNFLKFFSLKMVTAED